MKNKKNLMCKAAIVSCGYGIFSDSVIVPVITSIYEEFPSASMFLKNFVLTGGYLFSLFASLAAGILMKKISKRKLMLFGSICFFIGGFGAVFTSSMEYLALMRTLDGLSDGILAATALSLITELYKDERERASMIGLYTGVSAAFGFALSFLAGIIGSMHNWRCAFLLNGISVISVILVFLFVPETPQDKNVNGRGFLSVAGACFKKDVFKIIFEYFVSSTLYCILFVFVDVYVVEKGIGDSVISGSISSLGSIITFLMGLAFPVIFTKMKGKIPSICAFGLSAAFFILFKASGIFAGVLGFAFASIFFSVDYSYYQTKLSLSVSSEDSEGCFGVLNAAYNVACFISAYVPYNTMAVIGKDKIYETFGVFGVVMIILGVANIGQFFRKSKV